jgi:hypothetical protein
MIEISCYVCGASTLHVHRNSDRPYCRDCSRDSAFAVPVTYSADDNGVRIIKMSAQLSA